MSISEENIKIAYLTPNQYSRPRRALNKVKGLALHWVGNAGTSAMFNRNFFEERKNGKLGYGSAHYIIGLGGEIVQCIPLAEMAYHVGADEYTPYALGKFGIYPNNCTIGIEFCHIDWFGKYTQETIDSAIELCTDLCDHFDLEPLDDITTHHAITGKLCPKWFVVHPVDFEGFKQNVHRRFVGRSI